MEPFVGSLAAGGVAGIAVDVCLFPLDTIKTRLQAKEGFVRSGGFAGIYRGLGAAAVASAPAAGVFFAAYDTAKTQFARAYPDMPSTARYMAAAVMGEMASAGVRVPFEIIKQQMQTKMFSSYRLAWRNVVHTMGFGGVLRSYVSLVSREVPFALLQYPLYEYFKRQLAGADDAASWRISLAGSLAGGISAAATTPLDVAKTRVMLQGERGTYATLFHISRTEGPAALFHGIVPRVLWISLGGAIFFSVYEHARSLFS